MENPQQIGTDEAISQLLDKCEEVQQNDALIDLVESYFHDIGILKDNALEYISVNIGSAI